METTALALRDGRLQFDVNIHQSLQSGGEYDRHYPKRELRERVQPFSEATLEKALQSIDPSLKLRGDLVLRNGPKGPEVIAELPADLFGKRDEDTYEFNFFPEGTKVESLEQFKSEMKVALDILAVVLDLSERSYLGKPRNEVKRVLPFGPEIVPGEGEGGMPMAALLAMLMGGAGGGGGSLEQNGPKKPGEPANLNAAEAALYEKMLVRNVGATKFADIKGQPKAVAALKDVVLELQAPETFQRWGVDDPGHVLMSGPPGTGKSMLAKATAHEAQVPFLILTSAMVGSKWLGEMEKLMAMVFRVAEAAAENSPSKKAILFIDEIEGLFPKRDDMTHEAIRKAINEALTAVDGLKTAGSVKIIGATNRPDLLDPAMQSRLTNHIDVLLPNLEARAEIWESQLKDREKKSGHRLYDAIDFAEIASRSEGMSGRDIKNVIQRVVRQKARQSVIEEIEAPLVTMADVLTEFADRTPRPTFGLAALRDQQAERSADSNADFEQATLPSGKQA